MEVDEPTDANAPKEPIDDNENESDEANDNTNEAEGNTKEANDGYIEPKRIFPISRIKKIMRCDPDIRTLNPEAPALFAKACELFIMDLAQHSWEGSKRTMLGKVDICAAIQKVDKFDFLIDIVPRDEGPKKNDGR